MQDHHRVGALAADLVGVAELPDLVFRDVCTGIGADQQHVHGLARVVVAAVAQHVAAERDLVQLTETELQIPVAAGSGKDAQRQEDVHADEHAVQAPVRVVLVVRFFTLPATTGIASSAGGFCTTGRGAPGDRVDAGLACARVAPAPVRAAEGDGSVPTLRATAFFGFADVVAAFFFADAECCGVRFGALLLPFSFLPGTGGIAMTGGNASCPRAEN